MAFLNQNSKLIVVLVLVVALFAFVIGIMVGAPFEVVTLNTKSSSGNVYGFEARGGNPGVEYFDASMFVTAHSPNLDSEKVVIKGEVARHFGALSCLTQWRWRVYTTSNGISWNELSTSPYTFDNSGTTFSDQFVAIPNSPTIQLRGLYEGGIKVVLEFHIKDVTGPFCSGGFDKGFLWVGEDQAYLRAGIGSVRAPAQAQVGDTISVCVDIPYVASEKDPGKGWLLYGYSKAQDEEILRVDPIERSGTSCFSYTVAAADFVVSQSCTTENRLEWHLFNELWAKDFTFTTTVDVSRFAPSLRITGISGDREVGKPITVSWTATPNPTTNYSILRVVLAYGFGGIDDERTFTTETSYTITPGQGGVLHLEIYAVDSGCRPSPVEKTDVQIREPGQGGAPVPEANLLLFLLPIIAFSAIGAIVAAFAKIPMWARVLIVVVFLLVGVLVGVALVPAILFPGG